MMHLAPNTSVVDRPFPLMRSFAIYVLPLLFVAVLGLVMTLRSQLSLSIETFFSSRELATAKMILRSVNTAHPIAMNGLVTGSSPEISSYLDTEMKELNIPCFAILSSEGKTLYTGGIGGKCAVPSIDSFSETLESGQPKLHENLVHKGYWSTLAQMSNPQGEGKLLIAISRPDKNLERAIGRLARNQMLLFGALLLIGCGVMTWLVYRAQNALNASFSELARIRGRLEKFLSKSARETAFSGNSASTRQHGVVLFADLRNFSGFAETASLEDTASLVDSFVSVVTEAVDSNNGDVDKLLGDGVLAWFAGEDAAKRAVQASVLIVRQCASLPRVPGIGLFAGDVYSVTLGHGNRQDFTILGKVVNLASRLCSISGEGEITTPGDMNEPGDAGLDCVRTENVVLKNHATPVHVSSYRIPE